MVAGDYRVPYTAPCPTCGADAEFVSVGETDGNFTRLARVEVLCPCPIPETET